MNKAQRKDVRHRDMRKRILEQLDTAEGYAELALGMELYGWQRTVLEWVNYRNIRISLKAANGSGKTSTVVCAAVLWHMKAFPGSLVVCTAGVYRQVKDALWPHLRRHIYGLGGDEVGWKVNEGEIRLERKEHPGQISRCVGFSAESPEKAEGWHQQGSPHPNLLYVIDEAKAVQDGIFQSMERCQPSRVILVSSPGGRSGYFYETFTKNAARWKTFTVTAFDCPHITNESIDRLIQEYGENHPLIRSSIYAEFIDGDSGDWRVFKAEHWQAAVNSPPEEQRQDEAMIVGLDFAAGGDETVMVFRRGNRVHRMSKWKEQDTMAGVGRIINELRRENVDPRNVYADAGGLGASMCDRLRENGFDVVRVNFGDKAIRQDRYVSRGAEMWMRFGLMMERKEIVLGPVKHDEVLLYQFLNRTVLAKSDGKIRLETKDELRNRGVSSPDRADAMVLAFCAEGADIEAYRRHIGYDGKPLIQAMREDSFNLNETSEPELEDQMA